MVSRRLWIPDEELKADRVAQAQKMLGDAFKGVRDAAGSAMSQVGDTVKEDRLGWAQKQMEQAFSPLRQAPMPAAPPPMEMPEPEPPAPAPVEPSTPSTLSTPSQPTSRDASPAAPSMPSMVSTLPTPGVDLPNDGGDSGEFGGSPTAVEPPKSPPVLGGIGNAFDALGTKVNDMGFRAPGQDGKGVLGNTGLGEAVRGADQWSQANTPTPKSLSADDGLFGRQGPLQKALDPDVGNDPNLAGLKLGLETTGYPAMAKGAVRTGGDWLKSLDTLGTGLDKVTGRDRTLKERGQGALETGMGAIGAVAPQFTYIGNAAAERAKEQGLTEEQAETVGAVVGFLTPGGGMEQVGKAGAYLKGARAGTTLGRLGGKAEDFARLTGNLQETPEQLATLGRVRALLPAAAMGVAAPVGGVLGAKGAMERGDGAGDVALAGLGGAFRAADLAGGVSDMGLGAGSRALKGARDLPGALGRLGERVGRDGASANRIVPPEVARNLPYEPKLPTDPDQARFLEEAVSAYGGRVTPEGIEIDLTRHQKEDQAGLQAGGLGGVYYHPGRSGVGDAGKGMDDYARQMYKGGSEGIGTEGGRATLEGPTLFKRPLIRDSASDGWADVDNLAAEAGLNADQHQALRELWPASESRLTRPMDIPRVNAVLNRIGLPPLPENVPYRSNPYASGWAKGYAMGELARRAGYDSILDLRRGSTREPFRSLGETEPTYSPARLGEVIDLREGVYPGPNGEFGVRPEYGPRSEDLAQPREPEAPPQPKTQPSPPGWEHLSPFERIQARKAAKAAAEAAGEEYVPYEYVPSNAPGIADGATAVDGYPGGRRGAAIDAAGTLVGGVAGGLKGDEYDEEDTGLTRAGRIVGGALGGAAAGSLARRGVQDARRIGTALAGDETGALTFGIKPTDMSSDDQAAYERGWRASLKGTEPAKDGRTPMERADDRGEQDAWYQGYLDRVAERPKWSRGDQPAAPQVPEAPPAPTLPEGYAVDTINLRGGKQGYIVSGPGANQGNILGQESGAVRYARSEAEAVDRGLAVIRGEPDPGPAPRPPVAPKPERAPRRAKAPADPEPELETQPTAVDDLGVEAPLTRGEEMAAAAEAAAAPGGRRSAGEIRTEALTAENVVNPEGGVGRGATNPEVRATGPDSPGNLPKIRQNVGVPAGGPHPPDWDEATMGTRPTSEFEDTRVPIPSIEALKAREIPLTMADAQAIMSRQAAKVRRDGQALEQLRKAVPDHPALAYLTEGWTEERIALPYRQQGVRELAEANARAAGPVAEGLATNVKRESNRIARRNANVEARDQADREVIAAAGARGAEGTEGTDGATAVDDAMADAEAAKTPEEAEAAANKVVEAVRTEAPEVTRTAENTDLDGNPVPPRKPPPKTPRTPKAPTPPTPTTTVTTTPTPPKAEDGWWLDANGDLKVLSELEKDKRADADLEHAEWNKLQARLKTTTDQTEHAKYVLEYKTALGDRFTKRVAALSGLPQADILTLSIDPGPTGERVRGFMDQARAAQGVGANPDYMLTDNMGNVARANLIGANPVTMLRNAMGGASSLILHPLEAAFAAPISQATEAVYRSKGLDDRLEKRYGKEAAYLFKGYGKALPAAITNFAEAMKRGNQYQARGYAEELEWRRRNPKASFSRFLRQGTDKLLAPLTATDAFFRTLTQGGELFRQTYRTMKDAGADDATISRDIVKLLQAPRAEFVKHYGETQATGLSKGVQKEMDYRAFTQELDAPGRAIQGFQKIPVVGNLIMPFVTTPYNAAKFDLERSPVGAIKSVMDVAFAKRGDPLSNLKTLHTEMSKTPTSGEMAERLSRGFIGSAAFATLLGGTMSGVLDINGSLPDSQRERDEWEAEGRRPYSIAIGDRYVSFQELPGLNAPLIQAAIIKDILNGYGGEDKDVGMAVVRGILETVRSLATQPMAGGAMSALGAINNPGRVPESIIQGMAGPILPGSGLSRVVTTANDPFQREQAIGPLETLDRIYNPQNLPIRRDAVGNGMENWNAGLAALNPLRTNANTGFRPPTKYILSDKASTDVATDRAVKRVSDWKKDPINYPMPDGSDFIAADMAKGTTNEFGEYLRSQERTRLEAQNLRRKTNPLTGA